MSEAVAEKKAVKIGDYVITGKIGQGGIAEIYKGRQESLDREVAIKVLSSELTNDEDIVRRFELESKVVARLNHPSIVHVIDRGKAGNRYYFVMEYVDGTSLREIIDSPKIALKTKMEMIIHVCKALDYAHKNGVIHRDIKPANVLVDREGNARVADFGIAQIIGPTDIEMTSSEVVMGTMAYMSPEQKISSTNVDQTTDIYATGIMIYETLVGAKPEGAFKLPSELNSKLSPDWDKIILKCLAHDPKDRYDTAVELKDAILEVIGGGSSDSSASEFGGEEASSFVGQCRFFDTLKESRYSTTILVENQVNKRLFVIKRLLKGEDGRKESKLLKSLKHENIINIIGSGGDRGQVIIVTDYAQGGSLADRMVRKWAWQKGMEAIMQIASGLDFAHKNNIVHGNMRPSNVLFDAGDIIKLTDFGQKPHYDESGKKNWYKPPEHKASIRGDIYAMGVILHQIMTHRNPQFDRAGNIFLDDVRMDIPEEIQGMLKKLLAIRVSNRYQTCREFIEDYDDYTQRQEAAQKRRLTLKDAPVVKTSKQVPLWGVVVVFGGLLLVIAMVLYFSGAFG